ncbi:MAG: hypothetical protein A3A86_08375 [Elusimicrobia bacterium RIFCSPLOWO2_01_FULL_60_11]|nr:MAG: hypothetical protein A3A86_08375 [Elusimicrobia bacterium RIFCSPLOWO2_01_FULL_60_11]
MAAVWAEARTGLKDAESKEGAWTRSVRAPGWVQQRKFLAPGSDSCSQWPQDLAWTSKTILSTGQFLRAVTESPRVNAKDSQFLTFI